MLSKKAKCFSPVEKERIAMKTNCQRSTAVRVSLILAAVLMFVSSHAVCQSSSSKSTKQSSIQSAPAIPSRADSATTKPNAVQKLIVYYFHGNARCPTCFKLENFAKSEVETDFADAIKKGNLEWKTVNVEEKGNEHFNDDYKLYTKSIIVSTIKDGKESSWKNLDQIWQLIHDDDKYRAYIRTEVKACLDGKCL
jgi:hypothetical protein